MKNLLLIFSGPSGVGKGTILQELRKDGNFIDSVSCTTRSPREGELNGREYFFVSSEQFKNMIERGELLEYDEHFGNFYGTPRAFVEEKLQSYDVILEIEVNGALSVKRAYPSAVLIFIAPPSVQELKSRLIGRGSEDIEKIENRLARLDYELSKKGEYDFVVVNDNLMEAVEEIKSIIKAQRAII
ncbi:MAG: guanylate kinase [Clostridiales bacterium]|nr:guanylate kinase [Clostridiales bacterium]